MQNTEKEARWLRRGHSYKPNAIVRGCYAIADWLGDFAPMLATAKQGAINTGLVIANFIILVGILITSAVHSLELLRYAGAKGGLEYVLLLVWESVFLISSFLLDQALKRGMGSLKQSWQVWIPFLLGLAFVFASNFIGMAGNIAGMLIGGITPFLLLFIKWMLGWQLHNRAEFDAAERAEKEKKATQKLAEIARSEEFINHEKSTLENEQTHKDNVEQNNLKLGLIEGAKEDKSGDTQKAETAHHNNENGTLDRAKNQEKTDQENEKVMSSKNRENEQPDEQTQGQEIKQKRIAKSSKKQAQNTEKITDAELLRYAKKLRSKTGEIPKLKDLIKKANSKYQAEKIRKQLAAEAKPTLQLVKND